MLILRKHSYIINGHWIQLGINVANNEVVLIIKPDSKRFDLLIIKLYSYQEKYFDSNIKQTFSYLHHGCTQWRQCVPAYCEINIHLCAYCSPPEMYIKSETYYIHEPGAVARSEVCPLGMLAAPSSIPMSGTFFWGDLVMKKFLWPFCLIRWFKKSSCQLLVKECALSTVKLPTRLAQCG